VRPSPPLLRHAAHCYNCSDAIEHAGTGRRHAYYCTSYGSSSMAPSSPPEDAPVNHCASTLEVAPVRAQDASRRRDWSKIRQDDRQLHSTVRHTTTRSEIVRHACKSPSPWPIKGRRSPPPPGYRATGSRQSYALRFPPRYWHSPLSHPLGLGGHSSSPTSLVATPLQAPRCEAIQCLEHAPAGRTAPVGTRINQVSLVASTDHREADLSAHY
jgi:hypothetical protein